VVDPCSELKFADWWSTTAGDRLVKIGTVALDHRRFWDAMHVLTPEALTEIERRISARAITVFGLDVSSLALDMTNFATFIDSTNVRAPIAQRGKAQQKRTDLRLVGLGLVITRDGGIPLHHIRVHVFYCVLALMIAHLMRRDAARHGLDLSVRELLTQLARIQETVLIYPGTRGRPKARRVITDMTDLQQQLFEIFELDRWTPTS
jgi:hypothetical protein